MKNNNTILILCLPLLLLGSCKKYNDLQENPNVPATSPPGNVLLGIELDMAAYPWGTAARHSQFHAAAELYYGNQNYRFTTASWNFSSLRNVLKMEEEAAKVGGPVLKAYQAMGKFFRAYFFVNMTQQVGDIPLKDALKAAEGTFSPAYDKQQSVYQQCLQWLEEANSDMGAFVAANPTVKLDKDMYYNGDPAKWQRLFNSFRLRVLISLSKRAGDTPELNIKQQFASILNDPAKYPLISSIDQDLQIVWINNQDNRNPFYEERQAIDDRNPLAKTYVDLLKSNQDPRLFILATPTDSAKRSGDPLYATKFTSYRGAHSGDKQVEILNLSFAGKLSFAVPQYFRTATGDPTIQLGLSEVEFCIAEAINRGWVTGDAAAHYWKGIKASIDHYNKYSPAKITDAAITLFQNQPSVIYAGNNAAGLKQILEQKYVAFFQNSGWQPFYEQRRTGIPAFLTGPGNENDGLIPKRWMYPSGESNINAANLQAALQSQYGGADDINTGIMWLIR